MPDDREALLSKIATRQAQVVVIGLGLYWAVGAAGRGYPAHRVNGQGSCEMEACIHAKRQFEGSGVFARQ
jgi:hypothetical protein